jgi:hypothetical protein
VHFQPKVGEGLCPGTEEQLIWFKISIFFSFSNGIILFFEQHHHVVKKIILKVQQMRMDSLNWRFVLQVNQT